MARNINAKTGDVYRAVITSTNRDGTTSTWYEGPYATAGAARGRVTFWTNHLTDPDTGKSRATGHVEQAVTTWSQVPAA